jgi:hypothetical protein
MTVIFEPAAAIAAGLCLTARVVDQRGETARHGRRCGWCDYSTDDLRQLVEGYNAWAGYDERRGTYGRHEARVFQGLARAEQQRLIEEAQAFGPPPPEPVVPAPAPPADADPLPAFLRSPTPGGVNSSRPSGSEDRSQPQLPGRSGSSIRAGDR